LILAVGYALPVPGQFMAWSGMDLRTKSDLLYFIVGKLATLPDVCSVSTV